MPRTPPGCGFSGSPINPGWLAIAHTFGVRKPQPDRAARRLVMVGAPATTITNRLQTVAPRRGARIFWTALLQKAEGLQSDNFQFGVLCDHFLQAMRNETDGQFEIVTRTLCAQDRTVSILRMFHPGS